MPLSKPDTDRYNNIRNRRLYPGMTRWFNPILLIQLLMKVIVSDLFGQYADRRLVIAALDTVDEAEHMRRTQIQGDLKRDSQGALWIDFVADLGDGFDPTYAIATLLAAPTLEFGGEQLPAGQLLIMGGDEVYPNASREAYEYQLHDPYELARPDPNRRQKEGPLVYAVPGNHDWYDGLVMFLSLVCGEWPWHLGAWRTRQRRSYFALQLTDSWWLWATDIQLADDMDEAQASYFGIIAKNMPDTAKVILCSAEPGWLYTNSHRSSWDIINYTGRLARKAGKRFAFALFLSGDTHHYSRYVSKEGVHYITSGAAAPSCIRRIN